MSERALVTGGAGFIGSHLVDGLLAMGYDVRVLDNLDAQAHEDGVALNLNADAEFVNGDLRDADAVNRALADVDVVFHQGGMVGNGQSMYEIARYVSVNAVGTAVLLEGVLRRRDRVRRVVAASSMVVYGDGAYACADHGEVTPPARRDEDLAAKRWDPLCPRCGAAVAPRPTSENHSLRPVSPYGISKRDTEELVLVTGAAHNVEAVALRYLNVYGPRQALSNPYTGVAAIFATQLLAGRQPTVFEDGLQRRDLVHVSDVVAANIAAMSAPDAPGTAINIGTGVPITIADIARALATHLGSENGPVITGRYRAGDIRHCWADVSLADRVLGWRAQMPRERGFQELAEWVARQASIDRTEDATADLVARGLIR